MLLIVYGKRLSLIWLDSNCLKPHVEVRSLWFGLYLSEMPLTRSYGARFGAESYYQITPKIWLKTRLTKHILVDFYLKEHTLKINI